jgi:hypothetical protein
MGDIATRRPVGVVRTAATALIAAIAATAGWHARGMLVWFSDGAARIDWSQEAAYWANWDALEDQ